METKALHERAKKYSKYLVKSMGERVKIKLEEQRAIAEIETLPLTKDQKDLAKINIGKETQEKLDKLAWEDFKDSGLYVEMFEDLEYASTKSLTTMRNKLLELKSSLKNLDADDLRHLNDQIEKLEETVIKRNPYANVTKNLKEYIKAKKEQRELEKKAAEAQEKEQGTRNAVERIDDDLSNARAEYENLNKKATTLAGIGEQQEEVSSEDLFNARSKVLALEQQKKLLLDQLVLEGKISKETADALAKNKKIRKMFEGSLADIGGDITEVANALPQVANDLQYVFGTMDAGTRDTIESISEIAGGVGSAIQGFASGNYTQGVLGVTQAISGIFKIGDKKREREIQDEIKNVEQLQHAYEKLERAIENAYSVNTLQASMDLAESNIKEQIESTEKMIKAEEDKKDTDHERIEEWEREIESMKEQLEELENQRVESLGGIGSEEEYKSAAESFVDAWLSAYQETGDGLRGLEEEFDEVMRNLIKKQITLRAAQGYLEPLFKQIDKAVGRDSDIMLSAEEVVSNLQNMEGNIDSTMSDLNDMLSYLAQQYDIGDWIEGSSNLSGLQKGIQGVTEDTADIIASYLNSIRFFVAEKHSMLSQIADAFTNVDAPNPMLMELRIQTDLVRSINDMFGSVIGRGDSTHTGAYLKVKM
jgi:translation initiation factor 2B subunit (eIF-2B alpha/beta/delta family)